MIAIYTGTWRGQDRIEWDGPAPDIDGAHVTVTVQEPAIAPISEHARLLQKLAETGRGIETVIPDPVAWQKEMRSSRTLIGRDDG